MAFMPFLTAGDPDMKTTLAVMRELARSGVDLIEVGFPYSDPIADGPVIQASYTRALSRGFRVDDLFAGIQSLAADLETGTNGPPPALVAMVSYAIVLRRGPRAFVEQAKEAGFAGFIIPDLPADEAGEVRDLASENGMDLIPLIAPTTPQERAMRILKTASGFVYCISVAGITGVRDELPPELTDQLNWLQSHTDVPLAVGFGISRPEQVDSLRGQADGIIVGSAIVRRMQPLVEGSRPGDEVIAEIGDYAQQMVAATRKRLGGTSE